MEGFVVLAVFGGLAFAIAHFLGKKRQIGFGWTFFFCLLNPIFGFIVTMLSRKYYDKNPSPSKAKRVWGWILIIFFGLGTFARIMVLSKGKPDPTFFTGIVVYVWMIGLGIYLIELGKGKNFNTEALTKIDE